MPCEARMRRGLLNIPELNKTIRMSEKEAEGLRQVEI